MLRLLIINLLLVITVFAQTEAFSIVGGGGSGTSGMGNIDGTGSAAALQYPKAVAKSLDNQLLVGDDRGLKKVDIQTNTITTLHAFENATFHDLEVDSVGNIYAGLGIWVTDPEACNGSQYAFRDSRVYKFSSTGELLQSWGNECEKSQIDFGDYAVAIAIDSDDNVYAMSGWTPDADNQFGTKSTIKQLNSNGSISVYSDVYYEGNMISSITDIEYYSGSIYIAARGMYKYTSSNNTTALERIYSANDNGVSGIEFDSNGNIIVSHSGSIRNTIGYKDTFLLPYIAGSYGCDEGMYRLYDEAVISGVDALNTCTLYIPKVVKIGNNLFFPARDDNRIIKVTSPSNSAPTLSMFDFPEEVKKNIYTILKFNANDSDGFSSLLYCDFDDGNGEVKVYSNSSNATGSDDIRKGITYSNDGVKNITCKLFDNEGLSTNFTKSFQVGDGSSEVCPTFFLERDKQIINLDIGASDYFNITVCGDVEITSSDDSIATATESKSEFITEVEVKAIANGTATITVSDKNSVGTLSITVGDATSTNPITTPDTKEVIGNITFLEYEPEGYFTWGDADTFCKERGYRLPSMDELIYVWNNNDEKISPKGFEKDTFYWSSEILTAGTNYFQGCAMDVDCSKADSWASDSNGHPKCVVSVDNSVKPEEPTTPDTPLSVPKANYDDFQTRDCGTYTTVTEGLKVNGTSYRYGNILVTQKLYDVRDSITHMKWKANSTSYSQFAPQIVGVAGSTMTTDHSYGGSTKIESDTWYYTTMTVSGDKVTTITTKNSYNDADVVLQDEVTIPEYRVPFIKNGVQLGFVMGDTYASTNAYFVLSEFDTTAKEALFAYNKQVDLSQALSDIFSDIQGNWTLSDNRLSITNANLNDAVTLDLSNALVMKFTAASNQTQSNFAAVAIDKDGDIISVVTIDPSVSTCEKEYSLPLSNAVEVKFIFNKNYAIEHYESTSKDVVIQDITLFSNTPLVTIQSFTTQSDGENKQVAVTMDDKKIITINTPPNSEVNENPDKGITVEHTVNEDLGVKTTLNKDGSLLEEINAKLDALLKKTEIIIDLLTKSTEIHSDGSSTVVSELGGFILNLFTDKTAKVTPNYSFNGKEIVMPTFNSGSRVHVKQESGNILIEVKTTLTTKLTF